jgi:hypothetical protein
MLAAAPVVATSTVMPMRWNGRQSAGLAAARRPMKASAHHTAAENAHTNTSAGASATAVARDCSSRVRLSESLGPRAASVESHELPARVAYTNAMAVAQSA